jgi:pheromone shutdown protein TraB
MKLYFIIIIIVAVVVVAVVKSKSILAKLSLQWALLTSVYSCINEPVVG